MAQPKELAELAARIADARNFLHIDQITEELSDLEKRMASPDFWDDASAAQAVSKKASDLRTVIGKYDDAYALLDDATTAFELSGEDEAFAEEYEDAVAELSVRSMISKSSRGFLGVLIPRMRSCL